MLTLANIISSGGLVHTNKDYLPCSHSVYKQRLFAMFTQCLIFITEKYGKDDCWHFLCWASYFMIHIKLQSSRYETFRRPINVIVLIWQIKWGMLSLTHLSLASNKSDTGRQCTCIARSDAAYVASDQGLHCLHLTWEFLWNMVIIKLTRHPFY